MSNDAYAGRGRAPGTEPLPLKAAQVEAPDMEAVARSVIENAIDMAYDVTVAFHPTAPDPTGDPDKRLARHIVEHLGRQGLLPSPTPAPLDAIFSSLVYSLGRTPRSMLKQFSELDVREYIVRNQLEHAALCGLRMMRVKPFDWFPHFNPPGFKQRWNPGFRADALEGKTRFDE